MIRWFLDSAGNKLDIKDCLEKGLLSERFPLAYLNMCANQREWTGKPSTTMLINGTRYTYLQILTDYAVDPASMAFAVLGTRSHGKLENFTPKKSFAELSIPEQEITGIADLLEQQPDGTWWLTDYKTWGSYKASLALGLVKKQRPMLDKNGQRVLYKSSGNNYKKGNPRTETYYQRDESAVDMFEAELQLNRYRVVIEEYFDIPIAKMKVFVIVRDGGTFVAQNRGVTNNVYYIDIKRLPDDEVKEYFEDKKDVLLGAIDGYIEESQYCQESIDPFDILKRNCPSVCNKQESWDGRRCQGYCGVSEICKNMGDNPYLGDEHKEGK